MSDLIDRQAAIDIERNATVDTNPSHFVAHQKFTQFLDDAEISSFGRWQWSNGFNTALTAIGIDLKKLPSAQPEPCDDPRADVYYLAEKIGIHRLYALVVELRGEPEPCEDAVSRQAVEDVVDFECGEWRGLAKTIIKKIEDLPSAQPEQRWIPVTERLPKQGQEVICQCRANIIKVLKLDADGDWYQDAKHCYMYGFVIAWMPLPEPWKEGEAE